MCALKATTIDDVTWTRNWRFFRRFSWRLSRLGRLLSRLSRFLSRFGWRLSWFSWFLSRLSRFLSRFSWFLSWFSWFLSWFSWFLSRFSRLLSRPSRLIRFFIAFVLPVVFPSIEAFTMWITIILNLTISMMT